MVALFYNYVYSISTQQVGILVILQAYICGGYWKSEQDQRLSWLRFSSVSHADGKMLPWLSHWNFLVALFFFYSMLIFPVCKAEICLKTLHLCLMYEAFACFTCTVSIICVRNSSKRSEPLTDHVHFVIRRVKYVGCFIYWIKCVLILFIVAWHTRWNKRIDDFILKK
jgi:hypothetical protein